MWTQYCLSCANNGLQVACAHAQAGLFAALENFRTVSDVLCAHYAHLSFKPQLSYTGFLYKVIQKIPFFQNITNWKPYQQAKGCNCKAKETEKTFEVNDKGKIWFQIRDNYCASFGINYLQTLW